MSSYTIAVIPANASADDWEQIHRQLGDARAAINATGVASDVAASFGPVPPTTYPVPAVPVSPFAGFGSPAPVQQAAPVIPVTTVPLPDFAAQLPVGDASWLGTYVQTNGRLPANGEIAENWPHILADKGVGTYVDSLPAQGHETLKGDIKTDGSYKHLKSAANMARGRAIKDLKQAWTAQQGQTAVVPQPAPTPVQTMNAFAGMAGMQPVPSPTIAVPAQNVVQPAATPVSQQAIVQYGTQLTADKRQAIVDWASGAKPGSNALSDHNQGVLWGYLQGDVDAATGRPMSTEQAHGMLLPKARDKFLKLVTV